MYRKNDKITENQSYNCDSADSGICCFSNKIVNLLENFKTNIGSINDDSDNLEAEFFQRKYLVK